MTRSSDKAPARPVAEREPVVAHAINRTSVIEDLDCVSGGHCEVTASAFLLVTDRYGLFRVCASEAGCAALSVAAVAGVHSQAIIGSCSRPNHWSATRHSSDHAAPIRAAGWAGHISPGPPHPARRAHYSGRPSNGERCRTWSIAILPRRPHELTESASPANCCIRVQVHGGCHAFRHI
jgi:hypothetical protein